MARDVMTRARSPLAPGPRKRSYGPILAPSGDQRLLLSVQTRGFTDPSPHRVSISAEDGSEPVTPASAAAAILTLVLLSLQSRRRSPPFEKIAGGLSRVAALLGEERAGALCCPELRHHVGEHLALCREHSALHAQLCAEVPVSGAARPWLATVDRHVALYEPIAQLVQHRSREERVAAGAGVWRQQLHIDLGMVRQNVLDLCRLEARVSWLFEQYHAALERDGQR